MKKDTTKSAEQIVFEKVKSALYKRRLAPGTALTEQSLCDALGVGRTPVRSALKRLAQDGYVEIVPNKGAYVTHGGPEQISQLYDVRIPLELLAVKVTMDSYTDEDFQFLTSCIEKEKLAFEGKNLEAYLKTIEDFHMYIIRKSQNPYLEQAYKVVFQKILVYLALYDRFYLGTKKKLHSIPTHTRIIDAIRNKNLKKLEKLLVEQQKVTIDEFDFSGCYGANIGLALLDWFRVFVLQVISCKTKEDFHERKRFTESQFPGSYYFIGHCCLYYDLDYLNRSDSYRSRACILRGLMRNLRQNTRAYVG